MTEVKAVLKREGGEAPPEDGMEAAVLDMPGALPGDWQTETCLHQGTMSEVWLLRSQKVRWKLALKLAAQGREAGWAMGREIELLQQLRGEGIPFLYHEGMSGEIPWYTMPFYQGETLRERLKERQILSEKEALWIGRRLCRILALLHERETPVIYGDLKPENVMLTTCGGVYLLDYGNAWYLGEDQGNIGFRGTPGYAAPECWHLERAETKVDIFALGVLLHEMLEGGRPKDHFGQYRLENDAYKKRWQALIDACTALNAGKRMKNVRELDRWLYAVSAM